MNDVQKLHDNAMSFADEAFVAQLRGEADQSKTLLRKAYDCERQAAALLAERIDLEPSRSVIHRSAASLALDCDEFREAEQLVAVALSGNPPDEIAEELRSLLKQVKFRRRLELRGVTLTEENRGDNMNAGNQCHAAVQKENQEVVESIVNYLLDERDKRAVFVFGARPSISAGIAGGTFLRQRLQEFLETLKDTWKVKSAYDRTPAKSKYKSLDEAIKDAPLEYLITLGCEAFGEQTMINWLMRFIPDVYKGRMKYFSPVAYELTSHLMNVGLIRNVVSLNYDELLDKTLEDEVGKDRVCRVATIEDFEKLRREQDWPKITEHLILKPHGTLSIPMSMRHRYEHTLEFEKEKADVLKKLFRNKILVLIGYEARDEDFLLLLNEEILLGNIERVFVVKAKPEPVTARLSEVKNIANTNAVNICTLAENDL